VGDQPVKDTGLLIGRPTQQKLDALKEVGLRDDERKAVVLTATRYVLEYVRQKIWLPRCKAVGEALGPWRTRATQDQQETSPGSAPHEQTRARSSGRGPAPTWDATKIEAHLRMVAPAWTE
jgi:hypothetical protein